MQIKARVQNEYQQHSVSLETNGESHVVSIPPRPGGFASRANGGELLCLALATCYCNDLYREAEKRGISVVRVEVEAHAEFGAPGEAAKSLRYCAMVAARATEDEIRELMRDTDAVAEIQKTLRIAMPIEFEIRRTQSV